MDLIQAFHHEQWDFNTAHHPLSTTTTTVPTPCLPAVGAAIDYGAGGEVRAEVSEWMEFQVVTNQLSADDQSSLLPQQDQTPPMEDNCFNFLFSNGQYYRPKKVAKRQINNNINPIRQYNPDHDQENIQDHGLILLKLLLECAVAISVDNLAEANEMLLELTQLASPYSPSCAERLVAHFAKAMTSRVMNSWLGACTPLIPHKSVLSPFHAFNSISPFIKFAHFTSNQAILEASHHKDRIHIIDLDIMQGLQWPALFHILATRMEGPPQIRLTGMGTSMEVLQETGRQLSAFAKRLGLSFEFQPVAKRAGDVDDVRAVVRLRRGEAVAVHWLQHSLYDAAGPDWKTMHLIQAVAPTVVTLVEQDTGANAGSPFLDRFVGALHYYSAMFDAVGAAAGACVNGVREEVEEGVMGREIGNIVAVGGPGRRGEEKYSGRWRVEMGRRGFAKVGMSGNAMAQAQLILNMFPLGSGYTIMHGDGTLRLGWKDVSLYTASSWTWPSSSTTR